MSKSKLALFDLSMSVPFVLAAYIHLGVSFIQQKLLLIICLVSVKR
jgi:hypothetical protein